MSLTKKEIYSLAGQVDAACIIMREVAITLYQNGASISHETQEATVLVSKTCDELRTALRKISYEVDNVRETDTKTTS